MPTPAVQQFFARALEHHQAGRLAEAETLFRQVLAAQPDHAEALHRLGIIAHQVGRHDLAAECIRRATLLNPHDPAAHSNLGECYRLLGQPEKALASYHRALQLDPNLAEVHNNLGNALSDCGRLNEAVPTYRRALQLRPDYPDALHNLGAALVKQGQFDEAVTLFRRALQFHSDDAESHNALGLALAKQQRFEEAATAYRRALALKPDYAEAHNNLGIELARGGQIDEAKGAYRRAIQLKPAYPEAYNNLGAALAAEGHFDESAAACERAVELKPNYAVAFYNLGSTQRVRGRFDEATLAFRRAIQLEPDLPEAHNNLGLAFTELGQIDEALAAYRRSLQIRPNDAGVHSNLIYTLQFHRHPNFGTIAEEQQCWNRKFSQPWKNFANTPDPNRRLKIGYVSPDFRSHAVAFFLAPLLEAHDHQSFDIYCYASVGRPDAVTERLRQAADCWRDVHHLSDTQLAQCVRDDGIDILVDLAMHTAGNRLPAFARKPAPVQVSWLAYPGGSGLDTIDYRLTDARLDPVERTAPSSTEQAVHLPESWCSYAPIEVFPEVGPLPAAQAKIVTFGSLNQFQKIHEGLLRCWARLLAAVPASQLFMICPQGQTHERTHGLFVEHGIAPERVKLIAPCPWADYVQLLKGIDLALDTYPCNGMTTTCHSLWMGVPVITLSGTNAISRAGDSLLHAVGLTDWIAHSEEQYVAIAAAWAADLPRLAELRRTLRPRMKASPLMDAPRFTRDVEAAYRTMWQQWCAAHPSLCR